jgi:N-acetylglucosamine-6-phosphate deacetylase
LVDDRYVAGDVLVSADGLIDAVGVAPAGRSGLAVAGFVDLQVNGFGGVDLATADGGGYRRVAVALARSGVTSYLPTLPSLAAGAYGPALAVASRAVAEASGGPGPPRRGGAPPGARPVGIHLEGPFLAPRRAGAHRPEHLVVPDLGYADRLLGGSPVALVTVAAELPGSLALIGHLASRGVVVSIGHSDATGAEAAAAFDGGARAVTHLWNAQRPPSAREPGVVGTALSRADVTVCLIADLVHVAAPTLLLSLAAARQRVVVVTDAVALAGVAHAASGGEHRFDGRPVVVAEGAVRLADGTLAGSACPMDAALRNLVALGVPLADAVAAMTRTPARLLGRRDLGRLAPGLRADVAILAEDLAVSQTLSAGVPAGDP